ncbi:MAG: hypothetical protein HZA36_01645 [Parcubacteria group bacterium]|nr:hypothetical protein [Parcubacteria group bacterium]
MTQHISVTILFISVFLTGVVMGTTSFASEKALSVAITPPVFQVNLSHGDVWKSTVKVINLNPYTLSVRVSVADMKKNENSHSFETPIDSMERWVDVPKQVLFLGAEQSIEVPFAVHVPYDAPPGGHYAFLLVGIEPETNGSTKQEEGGVSSYVSASLFVRVGGDIREEGDFREFSTEKMVYGKAEIPFRIRFENMGNVHIRPHGTITIYDVWGKKKAVIPVNEGKDVRVLFPHTLQTFSLRWMSDQGLLESGFYRAEAQLRFGENDARVVKNSLYFFVIPFKQIALWSFVLFFLLLCAGYVIRMYIRWALTLESRRLGLAPEVIHASQKEKKDILLSPLAERIIDLRSVYHDARKRGLFLSRIGWCVIVIVCLLLYYLFSIQ